MKTKKFYSNFISREDLTKYNKESLLLYALELRYNIEDIDTVASNSITEGNNDKKMDLVYIDEENGRVLVAQSYIAEDITKTEAKENKASDLNTAASWLFAMPEEDLPDRIKSHVLEVRRLLKEDNLSEVIFWYCHNLPESTNVSTALKSVEQTSKAFLDKNYSETTVSIFAIEIGINSIEEFYLSKTTPILVTDEFELNINNGYEITSDDWNAYVTTIDAIWLYETYKKFATKLFSANIRDYLGSRRSDKNINFGIKDTVATDAKQFWIYNNGLTALVNSYDLSKISSGILTVNGLSIVNGAQTTGAIGTSTEEPQNVKIPIRFIKCDNQKTVLNIIKYNNSQNKILASDFRSNDSIQNKISKSFKDNTKYTYGIRRGGETDSTSRITDFISAIIAAQSLAAFIEKPKMAYHQKNKIWEIDKYYNLVFNDLVNYKNILISFSLLKTIEVVKKDFMDKRSRDDMKKIEKTHLEYLRQRGSIYLFMSAISASLEIILDRKITNRFHLKFKNINDVNEMISLWKPIVMATLPYTVALQKSLNDGIRSDEKVKEAINNFVLMVESTQSVLKTTYEEFNNNVEI